MGFTAPTASTDWETRGYYSVYLSNFFMKAYNGSVLYDYSAADIDRHYAYKEGLEDNRRFCTINHKATLAQVYTDVRYTREANEQMSATLLRALRRQGFLD